MLPRSFMPHAVLSALLALACANANAAPACALAGSAQAQVVASGATLELPALLVDCDGVKVTAGSVKACVQDARGRLNCRSYGAGSTMAQRDLASAGADTGLLSALLDMLKGKSTNASGVTRSGDAGLPFGTVVLADGLQIDFRRAALTEISHVVIRDAQTNALLARVQRGNAKRVDASAFRAGRSYRWEFASAVPMLAPSGTFTVAADELRRAAGVQRKRVADMQIDPTAQALTMALWLSENGLTYEAEQALERAGLGP